MRLNNREIIVVGDYFYPGYTGGAELTTYALTSQSPADLRISFIHSSQVNHFHLALHRSKLWIFTNIEQINIGLLPYIAKLLKYVIVEYDFKFCGYRSPDKHMKEAGKECDCRIPGMNEFISKAIRIFFMSEKQKAIFAEKVDRPGGFDLDPVLGSVFTQQDLDELDEICHHREKNAQKWLIVYSDSWIKGSKDTVKHAVSCGLDYEIVENVEYSELMNKLGTVKGLIYLPSGGDTCPRLVIEARLAGCELILNDNVMHRDEDWFSGSRDQILGILRERPALFWSKIIEIMKGECDGESLSIQESIDRGYCGAKLSAACI